jgi:uncharacterized DUF497 family protein
MATWDDYGEQRINVVGWLNGRLAHLTYTHRGEDMRVISIRKAEKHDFRRYIKGTS